MKSQALVFVPPPGTTVILQSQFLSPGTSNRTPGIVQKGDQQVQIMYPTDEFPGKTEAAGDRYKGHGVSKVLGAIQILIGSVHLISGGLLFILSGLYMSYIMISRYLYWGGILFIFTGTFLVLAEHYQASSLWKGSLILNITSSFAAAVGIFVFLVDILYFPGDEYQQHAVDWKLAQGLLNTILFFTILEFFTGIIASYSSFDSSRHRDDEPQTLISSQTELMKSP